MDPFKVAIDAIGNLELRSSSNQANNLLELLDDEEEDDERASIETVDRK